MAPFSVSKWQTRVISYPLADFNAKSVCRELAQPEFATSSRVCHFVRQTTTKYFLILQGLSCFFYVFIV